EIRITLKYRLSKRAFRNNLDPLLTGKLDCCFDQIMSDMLSTQTVIDPGMFNHQSILIFPEITHFGQTLFIWLDKPLTLTALLLMLNQHPLNSVSFIETDIFFSRLLFDCFKRL